MTPPSFFDLAVRMFTEDEDSRGLPYDDKTGKTIKLSTGGNVTIGIGRNLSDNPLTEEERIFLFRNDLAKAILAAHELFPDLDQYSTNRQLGLTNLAFNLGGEKLSTFYHTILAVHLQDWSMAGEHLRDSAWYKQVGKRAVRVVKLIEEDVYEY